MSLFSAPADFDGNQTRIFAGCRNIFSWRVALVGLSVMMVAGCAHRTYTTYAPAQPPSPPSVERTPAILGEYVEEGVASWYGVPFDGHRTSDGEVYNMHQFTAAHRTLPFGSIVRVTNLDNGKQTEVRINDRGPFVADRVIDLSLSAAQAIGMVGPGTANVRLEIVEGSPNPQPAFFGVQVGAFETQGSAERLRRQLEARYTPVIVVAYDSPKGKILSCSGGKLQHPGCCAPICRAIALLGPLHYLRGAFG